MQYKLLFYPDKKLNLKSDSVLENEDVSVILNEMKTVLFRSFAEGLAAPQMDCQKRIIMLNPTKTEEGLIPMINPEILEQSEATLTEVEGCLSFPNIRIYVERPAMIKISFERPEDRQRKEFDLNGFMARVFLHELDHLNGITLLNYMTPVDSIVNSRILKLLRKFEKARANLS